MLEHPLQIRNLQSELGNDIRCYPSLSGMYALFAYFEIFPTICHEPLFLMHADHHPLLLLFYFQSKQNQLYNCQSAAAF